jgi:outer membrane lipoprotein-sorting protein
MREVIRPSLPFVAVAVSVAALLAPGRAARADAAGDKVVAQMDAAMNRARTQVIEYEAVNKEGDKAETRLAIRVKIKGDKRLTEFLAPADMKGTKILMLSPTEMYVYLPAFGKVRRIASHVTDQGFMGLAFSQEDFVTSYGGDYTASIASEDAGQYKLVLTPKAGKAPAYGKLEMFVAKDRMQPTEIRYFNGAGTAVKAETRSSYSCEGDVCTPGEQKMTELTKTHYTNLVRKAWKVNSDIADDEFSKRALER